MLKKRMQLKKVSTYPAPKYPVVDGAEVLSMPRERDLGQAIRKVAAPLLPLLMAAPALGQESEKSDASPTVRTLTKSKATPPDLGISLEDATGNPYRVRKFSEQEIQGLIKELGIVRKYPENVRGRVSLRIPPLTESQGRQILERFFKKNGILLRRNVDFKKQGAEFQLDGYWKEKRIGFEFVAASGEKDLSSSEIKNFDGEHILFVRGPNYRLPAARSVILRMQQKAGQFLARLYQKGVLGKAKEIEKQIGRLLSDNGADRLSADRELRKIGPEALYRLRQVMLELKEMKKPGTELVKSICDAIVEKDVRPHLEGLNADSIDVRDQATARLIQIGPVVQPFVKAHLVKMMELGNGEVAGRCRHILNLIRN